MLQRAAPAYCDPAARMSLSAALDEYYALNEGVVRRPEQLPNASRELFRSHDICHVIFGLTTSLADETLVDLRTMLCTDVGAARYARYLNDPQARALFADLGWRGIVGGLAGAAPRLWACLRERARMRRRWPWRPPDSFFDRPLMELRAEFGIRVV